ncbi:hypothetical protein [Bradyrhizobium sp.]|uniref:hypothetical protein n=1 Tax=Bradyrhizobium sp. TaxID=376 RepID=UPI0039E2854B
MDALRCGAFAARQKERIKPMPSITLRDTGRGHLFAVTHENGQHASALIPMAAQGSALADMMTHLVMCSQAFIDDHAAASKRFIGDELANQVRGIAAGRFSRVYPEAVKIGRKENQDVAAAKAALSAVDPATPATAAIRARVLAKWDAANEAGAREAIALDRNLPYEATAALIESGVLASMDERTRNTVTQRYMEQRYVATTGSQSRHEMQPSLDQPLASGPDREAARRDAAAAIAGLNARSETLAFASDALRGIVNVVALATDQTPANVYQSFTAGKAA